MIYPKQGDQVRMFCDGLQIDTAKVGMVDRSGNVVFGVFLVCDGGGTCTLNYQPSTRNWVLNMTDGWTARQPNGSKYDLEVIPEESRDTVVIERMATSPEGAD